MHHLRKILLVPILVFVLTVGGSLVIATVPAAADNSNNTAATVKYCKKKLKKDSLCTSDAMNHIRSAVADNCNGKKGNAQDDCVEQQAEKVINDLGNPQNTKQFNDAVAKAIKKNTPQGNGNKGPQCTGSSCQGTPTGSGKNCDDSHCDLVALYVNPFINVLSVIVGLVAAGSLVLGGIQYTASSGDPQKTSAAKTRITNTLLAFVAYAFLYAFLNFLIPGGLFR